MNINQVEKSSNGDAWVLNINELLLTLRFYGPMAKAWLVNINKHTTILGFVTSHPGAGLTRVVTKRRGA